jgi:hypothetical protein
VATATSTPVDELEKGSSGFRIGIVRPQANQDFDRLDLLVNNVGTMDTSPTETAEAKRL